MKHAFWPKMIIIFFFLVGGGGGGGRESVKIVVCILIESISIRCFQFVYTTHFH